MPIWSGTISIHNVCTYLAWVALVPNLIVSELSSQQMAVSEAMEMCPSQAIDTCLSGYRYDTACIIHTLHATP